MTQRMFFSAMAAGALTLAACAHTTPVEGASSPSMTVTGGARWTTTIRSVTQSRSDLGQSIRDKSYGSATWTTGDGPTLSNVDLVFNYTGLERFLSWAILAGSCGTPGLPLIPLANFPELQIGGAGRAQVTTSLPITFPTTGAYHIDIYRSRQQGTDALLACGNLKLVGG